MGAVRTLSEIIRDHRATVISYIQATAHELVSHPGLAETPGARDQAARVVAALQVSLEAYEGLVKAYHTSSSLNYAFRDLPEAEKRQYEQARHLLRVLDLYYVEPTRPQAALG